MCASVKERGESLTMQVFFESVRVRVCAGEFCVCVCVCMYACMHG